MQKRLLIFCFFCFISSAIAAQVEPAVDKTFQLGVIKQLNSKELNEIRTLNIYLPEGYHPDSAYPVIYLLDGSADEDFIHIAGLVQFATFSWVNILPKSIVVGIANVDRRRDFTFSTTISKDKQDFPTTGSSAKFISFIEKELQPFIEKKYKTTGSRMLIGQSLGGLLATEILFKQPTLFNSYVIVSPSLWWDNESLLKMKPVLLNEGYAQQTRVYIGVGEEGKVMEEDAKHLYELLNNTDKKNITASFDFIKGKSHANIFHQAVSNAFEIFAEKK
jgi:predicted alpha/beta superfamily hydrolase